MKNSTFLRKLLSAVCCVAMLMTMLPIVPAAAADSEETVTGTAISGGSLSSFSDAAEITYTKAAEVTAGLGLFAGAGGKFMPKSNLTRAQMATIIVKMLYGSDANADAFKGSGKFSDTAIFEGGWAEGYINWCATLGVVSGYGDGTFKPGNNVTAAEAATMILNALKVDAGEGEWPHTVMAKAEELDMFDEFLSKPANDKALSREELAVMALVGLEYSPEGKSGYEYNGVTYDSYMDAFMVAGDKNAGKIKPTQGDSLAGKVFELKTFEGFIVANEATDPDLAGVTTVFDPKAPATDATEDFYITTGLEHVGHYVTVYYQEAYINDEDPGLAYTVYDETQTFVVEKTFTNSTKEYKNVFGKSYRLSGSIAKFDGQYVKAADPVKTIAGYTAGSAAAAGTYFVYEGAIVSFMEPAAVYATKVTGVNTYEGNETITLKGVLTPIPNSEDDDCIVEYKGIAKDDYVTYTVVGAEGNEIYVLAKASPVTGTVSKLSANEDGERVVTVKGQQYAAFAGQNDTGLDTGDVTDFAATYTYYVTADGKYIGWEKTDGAVDLSNAVFILGELPMDKADEYGKMTRTVYARGVDMDGKEVMLPVKVIRGEGYDKSTKEFDTVTETIVDPNCAAVSAMSFYYVKDATNKDAKQEGLKVLTAITGEYDEKTMPIFYGVTSTAAGKEFTQNPSATGIGTVFRKSSTLNITIDGELNQGTPLTATVKKGSQNGLVNNTGSAVKRHLLLSKNGLSTDVEVIVICQSGIDETMAAETVYVSDTVAENAAMDVNGYVFDVYNYSTGEVKQITLEKAITEYVTYEGAGYYNLLPVVGTEAMALGDKILGSSDYAGNASNSASDGLYNENVSYDQKLTLLSASYFSTASAIDGTNGVKNGSGAAKAVVVDLRDEETIVAHGVGKIDSISRIADLILENGQIVVLFDLCYSTNKDTLLTVFVKDVYYGTQNGVELSVRNGEYFLNGYAVASNVEVSGKGVTSVERIYELLNPEEAPEGYPPNEPAEIELKFTLASGKISTITVTKLMAAGEYCVDDFEAYEIGKFHNNSLALEKGWAFTGDDVETIAEAGGNQYLAINAARPKIRPAGSTIPDGNFTLKFDFVRTADTSGTIYANLCYYKDGADNKWIDFVVYDNGNFGLIDTYASGGQNVLALNTGKLSTKGVGNSGVVGYANAAKLVKGTWYTVEVVIDYTNGNVVLKVCERDDPSEILCQDSRALDARYDGYAVTFDAQTITAFGGGTPSMGIDNVSLKALSDWKYPITIESPEGATVIAAPAKAATGETVTLSCTMENAQEYALAYFTVNGQPIEGDTFTMGTDPVTVSAVLARSYRVTVEQVAGVSIEANYEYAAAGAQVTLTATLEDGFYKLATVKVNGVDATIGEDGLTATFTMPAETANVVVTLEDTSVLLDDNFSSYTNGAAFSDTVAKAHGYEKWSGDSPVAKTEDGVLAVTGGRAYLHAGSSVPSEGVYTYSFDIKRTGTPLATILRLANTASLTNTGGAIRVYIHKDSDKIYLYQEKAGDVAAKVLGYLQVGGGFNTSSTNGLVVVKDEWWHLEVTVDYTNDTITVSAGEVGGTATSATYQFSEDLVHAGTNGTCLLDVNTNKGNGPTYIDNVKIVKVWED